LPANTPSEPYTERSARASTKHILNRAKHQKWQMDYEIHQDADCNQYKNAWKLYEIKEQPLF
jgi:hypothetical protein